jgi:hypothetical protein
MLFITCFHLNRAGNGNGGISSQEHFENLKTVRGSYLDLVIFVQIFEIYLVTLSLSMNYIYLNKVQPKSGELSCTLIEK